MSELTEALDHLGYDKVLRGARAFNTIPNGWNNCFLAKAYGEDTELLVAMSRSGCVSTTHREVARLLWITANDVNTIISFFDSLPATMREVVTEWLCKNGTPNGTATQAEASPAEKVAPVQSSTTPMDEEHKDEKITSGLTLLALST